MTWHELCNDTFYFYSVWIFFFKEILVQDHFFRKYSVNHKHFLELDYFMSSNLWWWFVWALLFIFLFIKELGEIERETKNRNRYCLDTVVSFIHHVFFTYLVNTHSYVCFDDRALNNVFSLFLCFSSLAVRRGLQSVSINVLPFFLVAMHA